MAADFIDKRQASSSSSSAQTTSSSTDTGSSTPPTTTTSTSSTSTSTTSTPTDTSTPPPTATSASSTSASSTTSEPGSSTGTSTPSPTSAPQSTIVQTTVITENGQTSTAVVTSQIASGTSGANGSSSSGSSGSGGSDSHTGAIVGGVVGGVALLALLALLAWFLLRRRKRDDFDGNFDPDHVAKRDSFTIQRLGRGGDADLLAAARGVDEPEVTPYTYGMQQHQPGSASFLGPAAAAGLGADAGYDQKSAAGFRGNGSVSYHDPNAPSMPSGPSEAGSGSASGHGLSDPRTGLSSGGVPYGASPYSPIGPNHGGAGYGMLGVPGALQPGGSATPSLPTSHSTYSAYSGAGASAKEQEAFAARYAHHAGQGQDVLYSGDTAGGSSSAAPLTLRNPGAEDEAHSVVVHQDGGRARAEDVEPPNEIPPTYESIRLDENH